MVIPKSSCAEEYPALNGHLYDLAARYSPFDTVRRQIVEMTIMSAMDHPDMLFAMPIDKALFFLLNEVAICELGLVLDMAEDVPVFQ